MADIPRKREPRGQTTAKADAKPPGPEEARLATPSFDPAWIATVRHAVFCDLTFQAIEVFA